MCELGGINELARADDDLRRRDDLVDAVVRERELGGAGESPDSGPFGFA